MCIRDSLNSTQSFLGVIFAHFLYGNADRMTPAKLLGCVLGFAGVLIGTPVCLLYTSRCV